MAKKQSVKAVTDEEVEEAKKVLPRGTRFGERMKYPLRRPLVSKAELDAGGYDKVELPGDLIFEWNGREWNLIAVS
jgi:hypothetical protein